MTRSRGRLYEYLLYALAAAVLLLRATPSTAHEDTPFQILADGTLRGFPEQYGPASIHIALKPKSADGEASLAVVLSVRKRTLSFPECIGRLLAPTVREQIRVTGSWYHESSTLPPYINLEFPRITDHPGWFAGYSALINMESAELIRFKENVLTRDGRTMRSKPVPLRSLCTKDELDGPLRALPAAEVSLR